MYEPIPTVRKTGISKFFFMGEFIHLNSKSVDIIKNEASVKGIMPITICFKFASLKKSAKPMVSALKTIHKHPAKNKMVFDLVFLNMPAIMPTNVSIVRKGNDRSPINNFVQNIIRPQSINKAEKIYLSFFMYPDH